MIDAALAPANNNLSVTAAYYRSKAFTVNNSLNPLVAAALPIFSVITQCQNLTNDQDLNQLNKDFCHEIRAFESQAHYKGYHRPTILAARYALCCLIDESIQLNPNLDEKTWPSMLNVIDEDSASHDQFYTIVQHCLHDPVPQIDMLELLYLILSSGYQGQYANTQEGYILRENTLNLIYQNIRQIRGEFSKSLYKEKDSGISTKNLSTLQLPWGWLLAGCLSIAVIIGCVSIYFVDNSANTFEKILTQIEKNSMHHVKMNQFSAQATETTPSQ